MKSILEELRRRRVVRSTAYYLGAGWVVIGACDVFFPLMGISDSVFRAVIWAVVAGVPVVVVLSWFIQLQIRDSEADKADSRGLVDLAVMGLLAGALAVSVYINFAQIDIFDEPAGAPLVAVTPFDDLSEVGKAISFGLAEELQNLLVRIPGIRVMSPTASFQISRAGVDVISAMGDLDADFIVRGSITGNGKSFRVIVRLIDVGTSEVTWSNVFEGELNDVFLAQRLVAGELAEALDVAIEYAFTTEDGVIHPEAVDLYLEAGQLTRDSGSLAANNAAIDRLENALLLVPDFAAAYRSLCRARTLAFTRSEDPNDYETAQTDCLKATGDDPDSPHAQLALATLLRTAGDFAAAREITERVVQELPHFEYAYYQLGQTAWRMGDFSAAESAFRQGIALHDRNWRAYLSLGNFLAQNQRYQEAIEPFRKITELIPADFIGYASLGVTYYEAGDYDNALEYTQKGLGLSENSRGYFNLGLIYVAKKESGAAAEAFSRSLEMNPNNYRAQMFYASALEELGDETGAKKANSKALEIIRGLVEINPNNPYQLSNGATILASLGEKAEAIDWAERARSVNQSDVKAQFNIGVTYLTVGQTEKGIEELVAALDMGYPRELFVVSDVPEAIFEDPRIAQRLESVD